MERVIKVGKITPKKSDQIVKSRLGVGFEKLDRDAFDPEKAYDRVCELGVKWVRIQSGWAKTEKQKGIYDFKWLDDVVDNLVSRGLNPWICLCYGNGLYDEKANTIFGAVGIPPIYNQEDRSGWYNYVKAITNHFKGRVEYFEIWNEPDCWYSWDFQYDPAAKEYGEFTVATAKAIRDGNPDAKVVGGAVSAVDIHFLDTVLASGMAEAVDYISFHGYSSTATPDNLKCDYIRALVNRYNKNIGLIQGESGVQSKSDGNGELAYAPWTPDRQAIIMARNLIQDMSSEVLFSSYFSCMDMQEGLHGKVGDKASYMDFAYFGVLSADFDEDGKAIGTYTPKKSFYTLQTLATVFADEFKPERLPIIRKYEKSKSTGKDCTDRTIVMHGFSKPNGSYALAYWNDVNIMVSTYESTISFMTVGMSGPVRLLDVITGEIYNLSDDMIEDKGNNKFMLKNIPITESPLLLTFGDFI